MSGKKLLFYLGALLLVAGGYYYSEFRHSRQTAQEQAAKKLFQVKTDDITVLTLKSDKGEIQLQRVPATDKAPEPATAASPTATPDEWRLTKPIAVKADELTMNSLLNALAELKMQRRLDEPPADKLKDFGLEKPLFTLEFQAAGQSHQLRFGLNVPGDKSIYAQKDQDSGVLLISTADKETLNRTLTALRSKLIFTLAPEKVTEIRLIRNQDRLTFQKTGPSAWTSGDQPQTKLRTDKLEALLRQLTTAQTLEFVAEKVDDLKKYGLAPSPTLRLTLLGGQQEETLLLGNKQEERYFAQKSGTAPVILVDKSLVEKLPTSSAALEDRRLWAGKEADVHKVVWGAPDKQITAIREKDGWNLQAPDGPARPESSLKFGLALWKLRELEYARLLTAADAKKDTAPNFILQLFGPEDKPLFQLEELNLEKDQVKVTFSQGEKTLAALMPAKALAELKENLDRLAAPDNKNQEKSPEAR